MTDFMTHSTLSPSSNRTPSPSMTSIHSALSKQASDSLQMVSSIAFLAATSISLTVSPHGSIMVPILTKACSAAKSRGKTFSGVVRFPSPFNRDSRSFGVRDANSEVHQPSPNNPTSARRAPRSRWAFLTSSLRANSRTLGALLAHWRQRQPPVPHFPPVIRSYSENGRKAWKSP